MALIWADGFDHYGTTPNGGRDAMLSGAWAAFTSGTGSSITISSAQSRTGGYSMLASYISSSNGSANARRVIGGTPKITHGCAFGMFLNVLPSLSNSCGVEIRDQGNLALLRLAWQSDGSIGVYKGASLLGVSTPVLVPNAWQHIEYKVTMDAAVGSIEIRVNGEVALKLTNLNLGNVGASQLVFGVLNNIGNGYLLYYDDLVVWDTTGPKVNDFVGQGRVQTVFGNVDTPVAQWTKVGNANGYACINNVPPDGDTTYIEGANAGDTVEFGLPALLPETASVAGIYIPLLAKLAGGGVGNVQPSLVSGGLAADGADTPLTTAYTYWGSAFDTDPATGNDWSKASFEAAKLRIRKSL